MQSVSRFRCSSQRLLFSNNKVYTELKYYIQAP